MRAITLSLEVFAFHGNCLTLSYEIAGPVKPLTGVGVTDALSLSPQGLVQSALGYHAV